MLSQYDLQFGNLAVDKGFINKEQLQQCLKYLKVHASGMSLEQFLQQQKFLTSAQVIAIKTELAPTKKPAFASSIIANRYELQEEIGAGGMGRVYKVYDKQLSRIVALKTLQSSSAKQEEVERFSREARAMASLAHPHILKVYELGVENNQLYFTMDYIAGGTLAENRKSLGRDQIVQIMLKIAEAMDYAHKQEIIHRDLKPSNILLDENKEPKIMDFGLAKIFKEDKKISQTGMIIGTLRYMSPEQATGRVATVDHRSDVYSLGAVLYEMLTGVPPFSGISSINLIYNIAKKNVKFPPHARVSKDLQNICLKAMEKSQKRRYQSAKELANDFSCFLQGEEVSARSLGIIEKLQRQMENNKVTFVAVFVAIISLFSFFTLLCFYILQKPKSPKKTVPLKKGKPTLRIISPKKLQNIYTKTLKLEAHITDGPGIKVFVNQKDESLHPAQNGVVKLDIPLYYGKNKIKLHTWNGKNWALNKTLSAFREFPKKISMFQANAMHTGEYFLGKKSYFKRYFLSHRMDSPINTVKKEIYYGYHRRNEQEGILQARDLSFKPIWSYKTSSHITSFPLVIDNFVYFGTKNGAFYALKINNSKAQLFWKIHTKHSIKAASPIFSEGIIYLSNGLACYALNLNSGKTIWTWNSNSKSLSSPAIYSDILCVGDHKALYVINKKTGKLLWQIKGEVSATPTIAENKIFYHSNTSAYAVSLLSKKTIWKVDLEITKTQQRKFFSSASVSKQTVYWPVSYDTQKTYGSLYAIDSELGVIKWQSKLYSSSQSVPITANGVIYIGTCDGTMYAVDSKNGQHLFRFKLTSRHKSSIKYPAIIKNNTIYISSKSQVTIAGLAAVQKKYGSSNIVANSIEGEHLSYSTRWAKVTALTALGSWSNGKHLGWRPKRVHAKLLTKFSISTSGLYKMFGYFTKSPNYGKHRVLINFVASKDLDLWSKSLRRSKCIYLGKHNLKKGYNTLVVQCLGKNKLAKYASFGLDNILLEKTWQAPKEKLVAYYPFDGDYKDYSKHGNHARAEGKMAFAKGVIKNAADFDGKSWLVVKNSSSLGLTQAFTFSLWLYVQKDTNTSLAPILSKALSQNKYSSYKLLFSHSGKHPFLQLWPKNPQRFLATLPLPFNRWYMLSVTYDGLWAKFYIDGKLKSTIYFNTKIQVTFSDLTIGFTNYGKYRNNFVGKIDELRIYNSALDKKTLQKLYMHNKKGTK